MTLSKFEYLSPESVEDACRMLSEREDGAVIMAGGTDLLVKIRHRSVKPQAIIALKKIKDLNTISFNKKEGLTIGATALLADVAAHPTVLKKFPAIAAAAQATATVQVRNMGTVIGNLCNAAPSADNAPTLIAMGAEVTLTSIKGERRIPLEQFFEGPGLTALEEGEITTSVRVPLPPSSSGTSYQHISARSKVDISAVGLGAMITMSGETCKEARIVLGAVAPIPLRARKAEKLIRGKRLTQKLMERAGAQASEEASPITDMRATAEYRKKMVAVLTKRALMEAKKRAKGRQ
jgi:carbon-monoxide dehydrogenase medium subunit